MGWNRANVRSSQLDISTPRALVRKVLYQEIQTYSLGKYSTLNLPVDVVHFCGGGRWRRWTGTGGGEVGGVTGQGWAQRRVSKRELLVGTYCTPYWGVCTAQGMPKPLLVMKKGLLCLRVGNPSSVKGVWQGPLRKSWSTEGSWGKHNLVVNYKHKM